MAKMALLIGVSEYEPELNPLPSTIKDVKAIERILRHPELCGFSESDIRTLENPDRQVMEEAIEALFSNRQKSDLVLLFFSGHGIKDEEGKLYLTSCKTRKSPQGELVRSTAVPAQFIQESMSRSRSKQQVVILDCCFSGAFAEGLSAKDGGAVDIKTQLGGEGRVVLTSSTSTQYSFEQHGSDLSIYTRYLVEGIETGAADQDNSGTISVHELHEYAKRKVQETAPAMQPEIYAIKEGFKILIAKASTVDPKLKYRKEVEQFASRGEISEVARKGLEARRVKLGLLLEEAAAIEAEVVKPYRQYKQHLQQYEREFYRLVQQQYPLSDETRDELKYFQQALALRDEDITPIEQHILKRRETELAIASAPPSVLPLPDLQVPESLAAKSQKSFLSGVETFPLLDSLPRSFKLTSFPTGFPSAQWRRSLLILSGITITFVTAYAIGRSYLQIQDDRKILEQARTRQTEQNYQECLALANNIRSNFWISTEANMLWHECSEAQASITQKADEALQKAKKLLKEADDLATQGQPGDAIERVKSGILTANIIPSTSSVYADAQQFISKCAKQLKQVVQNYLAQDNSNDAAAAANRIPEDDPAYAEAQDQIRQWQAQQADNQKHSDLAQQALDQSNWTLAEQEAQQIIRTPYWAKRIDEIMAVAAKEEQAANQNQAETDRQPDYDNLLHSAQQYLDNNELDKAIELASQLPDEDPWQQKKEEIIAEAKDRKHKEDCIPLMFGLKKCQG